MEGMDREKTYAKGNALYNSTKATSIGKRMTRIWAD